jgi:hypothetical protein
MILGSPDIRGWDRGRVDRENSNNYNSGSGQNQILFPRLLQAKVNGKNRGWARQIICLTSFLIFGLNVSFRIKIDENISS